MNTTDMVGVTPLIYAAKRAQRKCSRQEGNSSIINETCNTIYFSCSSQSWINCHTHRGNVPDRKVTLPL